MALAARDIRHGYFVISKYVAAPGTEAGYRYIRVCQKSSLKAAENEIGRIAERSNKDACDVEDGLYSIDGPCWQSAKHIREQAARRAAK